MYASFSLMRAQHGADTDMIFAQKSLFIPWRRTSVRPNYHVISVKACIRTGYHQRVIPVPPYCLEALSKAFNTE